MLLAASGGTPSSLKGTRIRAVSSIKTMSQNGSNVIPIPTATPLTAAIKGLENVSSPSSNTVNPPGCVEAGVPLATAVAISAISLRSCPELNAPPAPVSMATCTESSASISFSAEARSSYCERVKAFLRSGRLIVMIPIPSSFSKSMLMDVDC